MTGLVEGGANAGPDAPATAYPRLFRIFTGSIVLAILCGLAAAATHGGKGLHPAPFLAMATLSAIVGALAFIAALLRLAGEALTGLRKH